MTDEQLLTMFRKYKKKRNIIISMWLKQLILQTKEPKERLDINALFKM